MEWTDAISVGVDILDADHRRLLQMINELEAIVELGKALKPGVPASLAADLRDYAKAHFSREEAVMQACGYPHLNNHRAVHSLFARKMESMLSNLQHEPSTGNVQALLAYLRIWWKDHIMTMDMNYRPVLANKPALVEKVMAELKQAGGCPAEFSPQKPRLLVIDNEVDICDYVSHVARECGYEVLSRSHVENLLELPVDNINIVVLDMFMPGLDGVEIIRFLAENNSRAKLILISGRDAGVLHSAREIAIERGLAVLGILSKPISYNDLQNMIMGVSRSVRQAPAVDAEGRDTLSLAREELLRAIEYREIIPFYQPVMCLATGVVSGAEALARWQHPQRGLLMPGLFIPLFEAHGLIGELSWLMLSSAVEQCAAWEHAGHPLQISVNFSPSVLNDLAFPEKLADTVASYAVDASRVNIEVTETALFNQPADALDILTRCRLKGFCLSIDDFGTGYSTLHYLLRAPYTEIKIDQAFVKHMDTDKEARAICESNIELGHRLNMNVIAEGIETARVAALLTELGCDQGQGYHLGKPVPAADFNPSPGS